MLEVLDEDRDEHGEASRRCVVEASATSRATPRWSTAAGREVGGKQNILVLNDEAHHAYRIRRDERPRRTRTTLEDDEEAEEFFKEATVWVDGLDRIHKLRGINFCVDLSATPYFLGARGPGRRTGPFRGWSATSG